MSNTEAGKVPVIDCVKEAWRFTFAEAAGFFPAALVMAGGAGLSALLGATPGGVMLLLNLAVSLAAGAIFSAAVLRKAVRAESVQPFRLALGADEFRLMGVSAALMLMFLPAGLLVMLVMWFVVLGRTMQSVEQLETLLADPDALAEHIAQQLGPTGQLAFSLFVFLVVGAVLVIAARLFVANAATIGERRTVILQVWPWSKGNVLRIIGALLLTMAPAALAVSVLMNIVDALVGPSRPVIVSLIVVALSGFVGAIGNIPSIALGAVLYRGLRPPEFVAK